MATIKRFEDIEAWQLARKLSNEIWDISNESPFFEDKGLFWQINKSTGSVMDNIAEGFGRGGNREFIQFLAYSRGSNDESRSQLHRAFDRKHIDNEIYSDLLTKVEQIGIKLNSFIKYLQSSNYKGSKFKK